MNLIIFDIDDTLTKSESQHQLAYINTMKELGISRINQNWREYAHHTDSYILKENYENNFPETFQFNFIEGFESRMTELILELSPVTEIKGSKAMIDYLNRSDYAISFATGSLLKPAFVKLNQAGINYTDELVVGSNRIYEREGIVQESIERAKAFYKVDAFDAIISVGDGIWDLKTAKKLGIHFIGIGVKNYADFEKENVQRHIKDWTEFKILEMEELFGVK